MSGLTGLLVLAALIAATVYWWWAFIADATLAGTSEADQRGMRSTG
jgi:hypothetical protein